MRSYFLRFCNIGGQEVIDTKMHSIIGACLPMQRCQLSPTKLSEDEASGNAYEELQEKDEWWLSYMQTTNCVVLLSRETLPRDQVSRSVLLQY
jgi:hypothetical protein